MGRPAVQKLLVSALSELSYTRRHVRFLLGTDAFIPQERRVALTPDHLCFLREDLETLGLGATLAVVKGAGARTEPPFSDGEFEAVGADLVDVEEAVDLEAFDVVHALKEPTDYEAELRGPFLRLGALHLASKPGGVCKMAHQRNFAAILDGATVGSCSYLLANSDRTPIVAAMSRFAGAVAGKKVVEGLERNGVDAGTVVIIGGGIAGRSAIRQVGPKTKKLIVVEPWAPMRARLADFLPGAGFDEFEIVEALTDEVLDGAVGLVFAHRSGAKAAEKVCHLDQIRRMKKGAAIADIAIDQGGSIAHDGYDEHDDAAAAREKYIGLLGQDYAYYAEVNMPREEPRPASETHADAALPYITALLALCAAHGGPVEAAAAILDRPVRTFNPGDAVVSDFLDAILQDLRNGTQIAVIDGEVQVTDPEVEKDEHLVGWLRDCAAGR
ncbi:MAG: hypothetical protein AAGM22_19980 [Acidobacteriota bacterium]